MGDNGCFETLEGALDSLEEYMGEILDKEAFEVTENLTDLNQAKLNTSLAYSINALLYVFLKTHGVSAKDSRQEQVKKELERVKSHILRIKTSESLAKGPELKLDTQAAGRMISNALSSDQVYVKAVEERKEAASEI